ncbi:S24 family peptidase [Vibrio splendidus]|uniref:S24 family peptidase n=1 Tax=Vibrio splendidus TaxID=29497 RepID=UPI003D11AE8E
MEYISDRIKKKRTELGLNQRDFAKKLKLTAPSISQWERGISAPKGNNLISIAKLFQCSPEWLLTGKEDEAHSQPPCIFVPLLPNVFASGGNGSLNSDFITDETTIQIPQYAIENRKIQNIECIKITGDSMEPTLFDGGIAALDKSETIIRDGKIYIFRHGGAIRVKKLVNTLDGILIKSINPEYTDEHIPYNNNFDIDFKIIGRVIWASTPF